MRLSILFILLLTSCTAKAGCYDLLSYKDDRIYIDISDGGCADESIKITSIPIKNGKKQFNLKQELEFKEECKFSNNGKYLSCRVNSKSPLSGATYERIQKGFEECSNFPSEYPAFVFRCIKGCEVVPHEMPQSYGC